MKYNDGNQYRKDEDGNDVHIPIPTDPNGNPLYTDRASYDALVLSEKAKVVAFRADPNNQLSGQPLTDFKVIVSDMQNDGHTVSYIAQECKIELGELKKMLADPTYTPFKE